MHVNVLDFMSHLVESLGAEGPDQPETAKDKVMRVRLSGTSPKSP
jgi:hypothetical protein